MSNGDVTLNVNRADCADLKMMERLLALEIKRPSVMGCKDAVANLRIVRQEQFKRLSQNREGTTITDQLWRMTSDELGDVFNELAGKYRWGLRGHDDISSVKRDRYLNVVILLDKLSSALHNWLEEPPYESK